ncbi:MAG: threonine ammonia-lyase [Candidatus Thorarchaeota archaeon]
MVTLKDIEDAYVRIRDSIIKTPVMTSSTIDKLTGRKVFFKCENFQRVGAFKFRGALNAVSQLTKEERDRGVIAHSSGNHAQALALAATMLGVKSTIVMPENSPQVKVAATRDYGAEIVFCASTVESRAETTTELMAEFGYTLIHPYDNDRIIAGAGTAALELLDEVGSLTSIFAPVGGGGLLSGTAIAVKGRSIVSEVIAVEPERADDAYRSLRDGILYPSIKPETIADGLRTSLSERTFQIISKNVDRIVTVSEEEIVHAMRLLWERMKLVVEPSGAVSLAGLIRYSKSLKGNRIGVIISGGNIDLKEFFDKY